MSVSKSRNFAFIIYPDSLPEDWKAQLETLGIPMAISPWHDRDRNERKKDDAIRKEAERRAKKQCDAQTYWDDAAKEKAYADAKVYWQGKIKEEQDNLPEFKKKHAHVLYVAHNPVTADSVLRRLRRKLGNDAVGHVEIVDNIESYYLYLTHESADAKAKGKPVYAKADIIHLNGFDISRYAQIDKEQKKDMFVTLVETVDRNNIMNMKELMAYIKEHGKEIGINSTRELIDVTDSNAWFLKMVFDGNYQTEKLQRERLFMQQK
jgi:hypothetical protein